METKQIDPRLLQIHPLNETLIPPMKSDEFEAFKASIEEHGIKHPLQVLKGTHLVIDGRNRLKAALELGLSKVPIIELKLSPQVLALYILRTTSEHRHLSTGQKAALAAEYVCAKIGTDNTQANKSNIRAKIGTDKSLSLREVREEAARYLAVSHTYVQIALNLKKYAPESFELLKRGEITLQEAQGVLARARIEKEATDRLIPELLELFKRGDIDPAVAWEISFLSKEGQEWLVRLISQAGIDLAESLAEMKAKEIRQVRMSVEEILNHPAVKEELDKKQKEIEFLLQKIESYEEMKRKIEEKCVSLSEEKEELLARIRELEEQPSVTDAEMNEYLELQERVEEMERKIEELELERDRYEGEVYAVQQAYEDVNAKYKELEAKVKEYEEIIARLKEALRKKKKRKSWVDELKAQHKREIEKYQRKLEKQRAAYERLREGMVVLTKVLTKKEQFKKRKELVRELYAIAGQLKAEDLHQRLFDAIVDPYTEKSSIFSAFGQVVEGLEALTEIFTKACRVAMTKIPEGGGDETSSQKVVRIEEARAAAGGRNLSET